MAAVKENELDIPKGLSLLKAYKDQQLLARQKSPKFS
jgi:hypothetical protein